MTNNMVFFPLTAAQKSIWQVVKLFPHTSYTNIATIVRINEPVQYQLLERAINIVVQQNDSLRTRIVDNGPEPKQYFTEYREQQYDLLDFSKPNGTENLYRWALNKTYDKIELFDSELFYFALLKVNDKQGALFIKGHHIATDAWSMTLLVQQILNNYAGLRSNEHILVEAKPSYQDYVFSEQEYYLSERFQRHNLFWEQSFATVPEFTTFRKEKAFSPKEAKRQSHALSSDLTRLLYEFGRVNKISPFSVLFSVLKICIWKLTNRTDIVISTPVLNRRGIKEKNTMGMFINNIPFRIRLNTDLEFNCLTSAVDSEWRKILRHQRYPYDLILKQFREKHCVADKLTDVSFSFQNAKFEVNNVDFHAEWLFNGLELNSLVMHVNDRENCGNLTIDYDYLCSVFSEDYIEDFHQYFCNLLYSSLSYPESKISELKILSPEQERKILCEFNDTEVNYAHQETLVSQFEHQVAMDPDKTALIFEQKAFSFKKLNDRSNQLARFLRTKGVGKDSIVGLMVDRSVEMIIAIFAVMKAGGAYLPIDPAYPVERIDFMLKDSNCQLLLTYTAEKNHNLAFEGGKFDLKDERLYTGSTNNLEYKPMPADLVNVIYTSGSTGTPKGVMTEHRGLNNLTHFYSEIITPANETVLAITTVSFDMFFFDTIFPLLKGMRVILTNQQEATVPYLVCELVNRYKADYMQATPSRMKIILNASNVEKLRGLNNILIGAETFPEQLLSELRKVTNAQIFNGYGPTEVSVCSTIIRLADNAPITIGNPIANLQIYILDESMRPVPIGTPGEMYISGIGLARGYVNNEALTKQRFIPNPFIPGSLMYKTGDIARWRSNGEIDYIGRNDNQVKIRGFRIELGEIENRLLQYASIKEAVVVSKEDKTDKKHLCAYLTPKGRISLDDLREYLTHFLPEYMIPAYFVVLDRLPLTLNGKVDRQALPEPVKQRKREYAFVAPRNATEQRLVQVWQDVLELPEVGIDDNLFGLGGDSLAILEILSGLFPNDLGLSAQDFYDYPTIRRLSDKILGVMPESAKPDAHQSAALRPAPGHRAVDKEIGNILLTGSTGFLGIHILYELLSATSSKIYCLIRGQNPEKRLKELLKFYFPLLSTSKLNARLVTVSGDITQENCGLTDIEYSRLAEEVSTVIHTAALVKHYGNYDEFYQFNVAATQKVIDFCVRHGKKLSYISTTSVAGSYLSNNPINAMFTEHDLYIGQDYHSNVYVRSKFEAENLIDKALANGLDATVFRVGLVTGRYLDGQFQKNIEQNAFYRLLKSLILLEAVPLDVVEDPLEFTPVDYCAKAIVAIMRAKRPNSVRYHVFNHKTIKMEEVIKAFEGAGISIKAVPRETFNNLLTFISKTEAGKEILSGIVSLPILKGAFGSFSGVQVDSLLSMKFLQEHGFVWPNIDYAYLAKLIRYMRVTGFLKQSSTAS